MSEQSLPATPGTLLAWATMAQSQQAESNVEAIESAPGHGQLLPISSGSTSTSVSSNTPAVASQVDPKWVDVILGKQDAVRMKELANTISGRTTYNGIEITGDEKVSVDDRIGAFEELEEMVENIDNACDLLPLGIWPLIISCFQNTEEPNEIRAAAFSAIGTAVQNNPKAQNNFLDMTSKNISSESNNPVTLLINGLSSTDNINVKNKALYAISALIRNHPQAFEFFSNAKGFDAIVTSLLNGDPKLVRRAIFLFNILITTEDTLFSNITYSNLTRLNVSNIASDLIPAFSDDTDIQEKCADLIKSIKEFNGNKDFKQEAGTDFSTLR